MRKRSEKQLIGKKDLPSYSFYKKKMLENYKCATKLTTNWLVPIQNYEAKFIFKKLSAAYEHKK